MTNKDIAIVYMVAGLSSRFGGKIKQFAKVNDDESLIEYSLNQALKAGFTKIIFVVGEKTEKPFKEMFGHSYKGVPVYYALQKFNKDKRNKPWGTADALCSARDVINEKFVVCNGDDIYGEESFKILAEHLRNKDTSATIGYKLREVLSKQGGVNRGVIKIDEGRVKAIDEVFEITKENLEVRGLNGDSLASMNIFAFNPEILDLLKESLIEFKKEHEADRDAECLLPVEITKLIQKEKIIMNSYPTLEKWFGITRPGDEIIIKENLKNKK